MPGEFDANELLSKAFAGTLEADAETVNEKDEEGATQAEATEAEKAEDKAAAKPEDADKPEEFPEGTPISSKSGAYTIPYEKLAEARESAKEAEAENRMLREQLSKVQAANLGDAQHDAQNRADAGEAPTQADQNLALAKAAIGQGVDASVFGDFDEQGIASGIAQLIQVGNQKMASELEQLKAQVAQLSGKSAQAETASHFQPVYDKHPDANEAMQSAEFKTWQESLPEFQRAGVQATLEGSNINALIEVFDTFKASTGRTAKAEPSKAAAPEAQRRVPLSLSEIPGAPHMNGDEQLVNMAETNHLALMEKFSSMTDEQREAALNRLS